jgi:non-specific serine/threonine protein kinase/serine/threonine-protein kinase
MSAGNPSLDTLFCAAVEIASAEERAAYLARACGGDAELRARVEKLVTAHFRAGNFLAAPVPAARLVATAEESLVAERPGTLIGPYKLLEQIGEGGMGLVFVAEQQRPVRRRVALKLIKPGMDSRQIVSRFEAERQALALMDHLHIARVFDGGTTENGRPYFVTELVKGCPITDYCDQNCLTTRERLGLFLDVCAAVQHAHQKGIIHRDLKPSNIMVTVHDVTPVVKVIDFGIAKATGARLTDHTLYTQFVQMVGTPLYMSPEQAGHSGLDVDTRSDVYALGVLLYELLTGTTPFDTATLQRAGHDELRRIIREDEPARPSARLSTLAAAELSTVAERRGADPTKLRQAVRGELDWIVMKCLEKDRNRRYESASALAADVQRYLHDEPVQACPPSPGYRLRKFARRNRRALMTAGVIAAALITATAVSIWQAARASEAQYQAEADRKQAEAERKQAETDRDRAKTAEGKAKTNLERAKEAEQHAATEAAIARAVNDFLQGDVLRQVESVPQFTDEFVGDAKLTVKEALDRAAAKIGERFRDQPLVEAAIRVAIGDSYRSLGEDQIAVPHLERAVELRQKHLGPDHPDTLASMSTLATAYSWAGQHQKAIALRQRMLKNRTANLGPDHTDTLGCMAGLAYVHRHAGEWGTSVRLYEELLAKQNTFCGPTHPSTFYTMHQLAMNYRDLDRFAESMELHEKLLDGLKSTYGPEHASTNFPMETFAEVCQRAGKFDRADQLLRALLKQYPKNRKDSLGSRHDTATALGRLAVNLLLQERYDEAEPLLRKAIATEQIEKHRRFYWMSVLGAVLLGQKKYEEAESFLVQGYEGMKQLEANLRAPQRRFVAEAGSWVVRFYEVTNQPEKTRVWREKVNAKLPNAASGGAK